MAVLSVLRVTRKSAACLTMAPIFFSFLQVLAPHNTQKFKHSARRGGVLKRTVLHQISRSPSTQSGVALQQPVLFALLSDGGRRQCRNPDIVQFSQNLTGIAIADIERFVAVFHARNKPVLQVDFHRMVFGKLAGRLKRIKVVGTMLVHPHHEFVVTEKQ